MTPEVFLRCEILSYLVRYLGISFSMNIHSVFTKNKCSMPLSNNLAYTTPKEQIQLQLFIYSCSSVILVQFRCEDLHVITLSRGCIFSDV
jgi:hypothetical protein